MKFIKSFIDFINEGVQLIDPPIKDESGKLVYPGLVSIRLENDPVDRDELKTLPGGSIKASKGSKINVIYAFASEDESDKNRIKVKDTMDALKNGGVLSKDIDALEKIIKSVVNSQIGGFKNIGTLIKVGSRSPLVEILAAIIYKNNPSVDIAWLQKKRYENINDALNHEMISALKDKDPRGSTKKKLDDYREAKREASPFFITKSGDMPSSIRQYFKDKYDFSKVMEKKSKYLNRFGAPAETISFSDACVKTLYNINDQKVTLVLDDNIHGGDDMTEIAGGMKRVAQTWIETLTNSVKKPEGTLTNKKQKDLDADFEKSKDIFRKYQEIYDSSLNSMSKYLVGLVTYRIKDDDLSKRSGKNVSDNDNPTTALPATEKEKKIKRVTQEKVVEIFKKFLKEQLIDGIKREVATSNAFYRMLQEIETASGIKSKIQEEDREREGTRQRTKGLSVSEFVNVNAKFINAAIEEEEEEKREELKRNISLPRVDPNVHIDKIMANRSLEDK
jgi:hypothetical protein